MHDVVVVEGTHDLADGVGLADGGEELVPQALPLRGAPHQAHDVDEGDRGRHDGCSVVELRQLGQPGVGHGDHTHVGVDRRERVVGREHLVVGKGVEEGRLADIGQSDDPDREAHREPATPGAGRRLRRVP